MQQLKGYKVRIYLEVYFYTEMTMNFFIYIGLQQGCKT